MRAQDTALILLASGRSQRFGAENKLLADLRGKPIISHVIDTIHALGFKSVFAVTSDAKVSELVARSQFLTVHNPRPDAGQGYALSLGARAASDAGNVQACVMLADMPFVPPEHVRALLGRARAAPCVMSEYDGAKMPPAFFAGDVFKSLMQAKGEQGAKALVSGANISLVPLAKRAAIDIDTPADLAAVRSLS